MGIENAVKTNFRFQYVKIKERIRDFLSKGQTVREHYIEILENGENFIVPVIVDSPYLSKSPAGQVIQE